MPPSRCHLSPLRWRTGSRRARADTAGIKGAFVFPHKEVKGANKDSHFLAVPCAAQARAGVQMHWANTPCTRVHPHQSLWKLPCRRLRGPSLLPWGRAPLAAVSGWTCPFLLSRGKQQRRARWEQALVLLVFRGPSEQRLPLSHSQPCCRPGNPGTGALWGGHSHRAGITRLCAHQGMMENKWRKGMGGLPRGFKPGSAPGKHQWNVLNVQGTEIPLPANHSWALLSGHFLLPGASSNLPGCGLAQDFTRWKWEPAVPFLFAAAPTYPTLLPSPLDQAQFHCSVPPGLCFPELCTFLLLCSRFWSSWFPGRAPCPGAGLETPGMGPVPTGGTPSAAPQPQDA